VSQAIWTGENREFPIDLKPAFPRVGFDDVVMKLFSKIGQTFPVSDNRSGVVW